ncbi:MAG: hypothetical protein OIF48_12485, partial [Silicimonas sp.]|nr:hypothetical protein [Silicimonas sp.]
MAKAHAALAARWQSLPAIHDQIRFGQNPGDDERTRRLKAMSTIVVVAITLLSISMIPEPGRSPFLRWLDLVVISIELHALWYFWRKRSVEALFNALVPGYFAFMTFSMTLNGTAEGDHFALMIIPCAAVVVLGPKRSLKWVGISAVTLIALYVIDPYLPDIRWDLAITPDNPEGLIFQRPGKGIPARIEAEVTMEGTLLLYFMFRSAYIQLTRVREQVEREKAKVDRLMAAVYPPGVVERLKTEHDGMIAEHVPEASVLFADLEGFTRYSETRAPADLITFMDRLFGEFDRLADQHGVEKIKTMGDGYLVAAGLHEASANHAATLCALGADMIRAVDRISRDEGLSLGLRVGVHSGHLVAGVMGRKR